MPVEWPAVVAIAPLLSTSTRPPSLPDPPLPPSESWPFQLLSVFCGSVQLLSLALLHLEPRKRLTASAMPPVPPPPPTDCARMPTDPSPAVEIAPALVDVDGAAGVALATVAADAHRDVDRLALVVGAEAEHGADRLATVAAAAADGLGHNA